MAIGRGTGDQRAGEAAKMAINSPLLDVSMEGAKGVLFNITGGSDLTLAEINEAAEIISQAADANANIIFGAVIDPRLQNEVKITVIATGFDLARGVDRGTGFESGRGIEGTGFASRGARLGTQPPSRPRYEAREAPEEPAYVPDRETIGERYRNTTPRQPAPEFPPMIDAEDDLDLPPFLRRRAQRDR
jgi:cell division protein FtsZ